MSALPVPLVVFDAENRFTFANHAAEQFFGVSAAQLDQIAWPTWCRPTTLCSR